MRRLQGSAAAEGVRRIPAFFAFIRSALFADKFETEVDIQAARLRRRRWMTASAVVLAVVLVVGLATPALAQSDTMDKVANWILAIFTQAILMLMDLMGLLILMLIDLLIKITQYNTFVKAEPVAIGWPIMRDTVNMFFIVVVLVSAFSTIIGYKDFHYKQVLPKLLIMAVLINFSKTLIGLMIDFSQVIVLTFVNGFKQAAGGNFIQALQIGKIMKFDTSGSGVDASSFVENGPTVKINAKAAMEANMMTVFGIFMAAIFGVWIMSITITLLIIMIIFFLARIIIIWMLLITSPVMFFAWALPGKMQKAFSSFTNDWWSRLSAVLVGGPTMAFFLWLSLAIAQKKGELVGTGPTAIYAPTTDSAIQSLSSQEGKIVGTGIGDPQTFATFIIMVAFMLTGIEVAVKTSQQAAPQLGALMGSIQKFGGAAGVGAAAALLTTRMAAKAGAKGARAVGRGAKAVGGAGLKAGKWAAVTGAKGAWAGAQQIEARTGLMSRGAQDVLGKYGDLLPVSAQMKLAEQATKHKREGTKRAGEFESAMSNMPPDVARKNLQSIADDKLGVGKVSDVVGAQMALARMVNTPAGIKSLEDEKLKEVETSGRFAGQSDDAKKAEARARAKTEVAKIMGDADALGKKHNITDLQKVTAEAREKDPSLFPPDKRADEVAKIAGDPEKFKNIKPEAYADAATFWNTAKAKGWVDKDGVPAADLEFRDDWKEFNRNAKQAGLARAHMAFAGSGPDARRQVGNLMDPGKAGTFNADNYTMAVEKDGKEYTTTNAAGATKQRFDGTTFDRGEIVANVSSPAAQATLNYLEMPVAMGGLGVDISNIGTRLDNGKVAEITRILDAKNSAAGSPGHLSADEANELLLQQNVNLSAVGLTTGPMTGAYASPAKRTEHVAAIQRTISGQNAVAFGNSLKQSTSPDMLSAHAEAINTQTIDEIHQVLQSSNSDSAAKASIQSGLQRIVTEAKKIQQAGGAPTAAEQQILNAAKKLTATNGREGKAVNRFIFEGNV